MIKKALLLLFSLFIILTLSGLSCQSEPKDGGIFKSTDQAESWLQKVFVSKVKKKTVTVADYEILNFKFDPIDSNILYAGTKGKGLIVTKDGGETWQNTGISAGNIYNLDIDQKNNQLLFAAQDSTIMRSQDGGINWEAIHTDSQKGNFVKIIIDSYDPQKIYAAASSGLVYKSDDQGNNWLIKFQAPESLTNLYIRPNDTRILYAHTVSGEIYKTTTGGEQDDWLPLFTKEHKEKYPDAQTAKTFNIFNTYPKAIYITARQGLLKSTDEGASWQVINTLIPAYSADNDKIINFTIDPINSDIMYFTLSNSTKIHKTINGGADWHIIENFPSTKFISIMTIDPLNPSILYTGMLNPVKKKGLFIK